MPYAITGIGYDVTMNGVSVGSGETDRTYAIPPRSSRTIGATTTVDNSKLDDWWVTHLQRDQVTDLRIDFYARVELPGGREVRVPLDELTYTETMETDIFGTKDETGADASGANGSGDGGEPTSGRDGPSETTADGATSTPQTEPGTDGSEPPTETTDSTATATETGIVTGDGGLLG